jgi:hypothetical protein
VRERTALIVPAAMEPAYERRENEAVRDADVVGEPAAMEPAYERRENMSNWSRFTVM